MARQTSMAASFPPVNLLPPAADAAGRTSTYASLKNALKAFVVVTVNQGNAATVGISLLQGKDVSGTGSKAISATPIYLTADASTSDLLVAQAAAASFTTSATTKTKVVLFEIVPEQVLDVANGFKTIAVQTGASNAANITTATIHVVGAVQGATIPSTLTN